MNFFWFVSILEYKLLNFKNMATKITTASTKSFAKIKSFLKREKVFFTSSLNNGVYTLFVFDLTNIQTTTLINKMTKSLHFTKQQEPLARAA